MNITRRILKQILPTLCLLNNKKDIKKLGSVLPHLLNLIIKSKKDEMSKTVTLI